MLNLGAASEASTLSLTRELASLRRDLPVILRNARAISWRPRRSAIRIVRELRLLVDFNNLPRKGSGTSSSERYTESASFAEMRMVEVLSTAIGLRGNSCPQCGQTESGSPATRPQ